MNIELIKLASQYVFNGPYFWGSMGFTTAMGMFVGALLYDGNMKEANKGVLSVLSYFIMLFWVNGTRVNETTSKPTFLLETMHPEYAHAGTVTLLAVTVAWVLGVLLGVGIFTYKYRRSPRL